MTLWLPRLPEPPVIEGDARSYLERAKWRKAERFSCDQVLFEADIKQAIALDPSAWEPWAMLAADARDASHQLQYLDEAISRNAPRSVFLDRGHHLQWLGRFAEAERDFTVVLNSEPGHYNARGGRSAVRAELGNFEGAVEDAAAISSAPGWQFELGQLQWIRGNFAAAFEAFAPHSAGSSYADQSRVWAHLCQVAHGVQSPLAEDPLIPSPARGLRGVATYSRYAEGPGGEEGPLQPQLWIWDLLTELFLDRIEPGDVLEAARAGLQESDAWRPPTSLDDAWAIDFSPRLLIWRSQVQFYCGMWFLSKRSFERARPALEDAVQGDHSRTLERLAAKAQLERLEAFRSLASPAQRLTRADPTTDNGASRFVRLDMSMAELSPTPTGVMLNLDSKDLRDSGLRMLLESPNLRFVNRLDLRSTGLSTAGMAWFRESPNITNLTDLNLSGNRIGDIGLRTLLRSMALVSLKHLDLSDTALTDTGFSLLAEPSHLSLETLKLGDTPVDMPIWCRLAERFKDGLYARGGFNNRYRPPFAASKVIEFRLSLPPKRANYPSFGEGTQPEDFTPSAISFTLSEYLAERWKRATALDHPAGRFGKSVDSHLTEIRDLESRLGNNPSNPIVVESDEGFSLLRGGKVSPFRIYCAGCAAPLGPSALTFEERFLTRAAEYVCPSGHVLFRWAGDFV